MQILASRKVLALLALAALGAVTARAEVVTSPVQALRLLTEARLLADKCGYLKPEERRELMNLAVRAELVTVRRVGAAAARDAVKQGRAAATGCGDERRTFVRAVYEGAHEAARRAIPQRQRQAARLHSRQPAPAAVPRRRARLRRVGAVSATSGIAAARGPLARYRALATTYYLALKCRNRPQGELMRMWRRVRDVHYATLRQAGVQAVARAKRAAERAARARSCR